MRVAGAGVLGLSIAAELGRAGATVAVFDPSPGTSASSVAAGMLAPAFEAGLDAFSAPHLPLYRAARDMWPSFAARMGIVLDRSGALYVDDRQQVVADAFKLRGIAHEVRPEGVFTPEDLRIDPEQALARLRGVAIDHGVAFMDEPITAASPRSHTIAATGWSPVGWAPESAVVTGIKGQIIKTGAAPHEGPVLRRDAGYIAPAPGGALVGATMQPGVTDLAPDAAIYDLLARLLPAEMGAQAFKGQVRVGVRGATPDGLPLVGPSAAPRVWLAMGARRNGWLLAPLVAAMMRAYLAGDDTGPWTAMLDARRFTAKAEKSED
ncbi:tRNA 5-methylaminomethyl-2-thiouridine biosynthesis bifunctional protein MnmC [Caulobacter sp. NIBR1757]|nr:tRNA 5-methylaminomethyl-2-thiouridine biosynthesis bifunctional protein MnmC [Caulobacter sp. NIBR1757]